MNDNFAVRSMLGIPLQVSIEGELGISILLKFSDFIHSGDRGAGNRSDVVVDGEVRELIVSRATPKEKKNELAR